MEEEYNLIRLRNGTFQGFCESLRKVFADLVDEEWLKKRVLSELELGRRILLLDKLIKEGATNFSALSAEELRYFLLVTLEAFSVVLAKKYAGSQENARLFGTKKDIRGRLGRVNRDDASSWFFSLLIQAWYRANGNKVLNLDGFKEFNKGKRKADFLVSPDSEQGSFELIECKKINPGFRKGEDISFEELSGKVVSLIKEVIVPQLESSALILNDTYKIENFHAFVDVSSYKENSTFLIPDKNRDGTHGYGFSRKEVELIVGEIIKKDLFPLNRLTLCWSNFLVVESFTRTVSHGGLSICLNSDKKVIKDYEGWAVEMYPKQSLEGVREIRVSTVVRDWGWILTSFNNLSDPSSFAKTGEIVKV